MKIESTFVWKSVDLSNCICTLKTLSNGFCLYFVLSEFLDGEFQKDLNTENVLGSGGKLAVCFAVLMRVLWSGKYISYPPSKLKVIFYCVITSVTHTAWS